MAIFTVTITETPDPDVVTVLVTKRILFGSEQTEYYDAPASVLTDDKIIRNLVRLSRLEIGLVPIKAK